MELVLSEDQELLAKTALDFVNEHSPVSRFRKLRDAKDELGFSRALWKEIAGLGWVGIPFPEAHGGAGLGLAELSIVLEALGRRLAPEPFLSTVLLGGQAILLGGNETQQGEWLPKVCEGDAILALAQQEAGSRWNLAHVETQAERASEGWRLRGRKIQVLDAGAADAIVVPARTSGASGDPRGITLFLVRRGTVGLSIERQWRVDGRAAGIVTLDGVAVGRGELLGEIDAGHAVLERVVDRATAGLCAELLGIMLQASEDTFAHLRDRVQFGVPIGSFQGLKHRAARMYMETELARSCTMAAARAIDEGSDDAAALVSLAKARLSDGAMLVTNEAVQMFGGVGMTDEYDIGFYLKRARAAELTFGDAAFHRDRWARLQGY